MFDLPSYYYPFSMKKLNKTNKNIFNQKFIHKMNFIFFVNIFVLLPMVLGDPFIFDKINNIHSTYIYPHISIST